MKTAGKNKLNKTYFQRRYEHDRNGSSFDNAVLELEYVAL